MLILLISMFLGIMAGIISQYYRGDSFEAVVIGFLAFVVFETILRVAFNKRAGYVDKLIK